MTFYLILNMKYEFLTEIFLDPLLASAVSLLLTKSQLLLEVTTYLSRQLLATRSVGTVGSLLPCVYVSLYLSFC